MEAIAKEYYKSYVASNETFNVHHFLADQILNFKPKSVFEFGCGSGKNLKLLLGKSDKITKATGIDVSLENIKNTHKLNSLDDCWLADENFLYNIKDNSYDVVFTCSVLDHIWEVHEIIKNLIRIARKGIVLMETNSMIAQYYYAHNYESFGFRKMNWKYLSNEAHDADGALYEIWIYNKNELDSSTAS